MPAITFTEIITGSVILMKAFPIFTVILLCTLLIGIGAFIKTLKNEKNAEIRIKKVANALVLAIFLPVACYFFVLILYPVFF